MSRCDNLWLVVNLPEQSLYDPKPTKTANAENRLMRSLAGTPNWELQSAFCHQIEVQSQRVLRVAALRN
jgi:hypothetical protein